MMQPVACRAIRFAFPFILLQCVLACCDLGESWADPPPTGGNPSAANSTVDYQREIQPIFAEHCARCHGVDEATREADLRLDVRQAAIDAGAIVAGDSAASGLVERITSDDPDLVMPPPSERKPLTDQQVTALARWIDQGAKYSDHWAFTPPEAVDPTIFDGPDANIHPIDAIVIRKLKQWNMAPAEPADEHVLCRRLYLDLIGLPPTPEQIDAFVRDGLEHTIDQLLASHHFGEKWARHWLDLARYSDTNGYEKDLRRDQWIWRDWVIGAINDDQPYDEFIIEQIAGDLLDHPTQDQVIATGFLRNSMINEEGAIVPEQFRMVEMFDRIDCIGKSILGLTTGCAQCHSHKFDPLTQTEYFGMFAFLNNTYEAQSRIYNEPQQQQLHQFQQQFDDLNDRVRALTPEWQSELSQWEQAVSQRQADWDPVTMSEFGSVSGLVHPTQNADQSIMLLGHTSAEAFFISENIDISGITGVRLEVLTHADLEFRGPGRDSIGSWQLQEFEVWAQQPSDAHDHWNKIGLADATADWSEPRVEKQEGKQVTGPVELMIDGNKQTSWKADRGRGRRNQPSVAAARFAEPLDLPAGTRLKFHLHTGRDGLIGCCRVSLTRDPQPTVPPVDYAAALAMRTPADQRTQDQQDTIFNAWRRTLPVDRSLQPEFDQLWTTYPEAMTSVLHLLERTPDQQRTTHLLDRGEWDQPLAEVTPHTPAALHPMVRGDGPPRLDFARWLASENSPLTARVAVNQVWQAIFGTGLVETSEDFGTRAPVPDHQELLDWLAVDFMRHGWSRKRLIRRIVTSRIYQQDSKLTPELMRMDPNNQRLARGPRFRADAEVIRDITLSVAGILHDRMGGPSIIPPVPENVLKYNYTVPNYWKPAPAPDRYRRAIYGFRKRSMPDPVMSSFDSPNGDTSCARRERSNTPLAALTGLNETIFVEAARGLAQLVMNQGLATDAERIVYAFRRCTGRRPRDDERELITHLLRNQRQRLKTAELDATEIVTGQPEGKVNPPVDSDDVDDLAAWMLTAHVLLNLDETITKN